MAQSEHEPIDPLAEARKRQLERIERFRRAGYHVNPNTHRPEAYLGDAVYASWDGFSIWLDTRASGPEHQVQLCLGPEELEALDRFRAPLGESQLRPPLTRELKTELTNMLMDLGMGKDMPTPEQRRRLVVVAVLVQGIPVNA